MGLVHHDEHPLIEVEQYPRELLDMCRIWNVEPERLLDWAVRKGEVSVILPNGAKASLTVRRVAKAAQPPKPAKGKRE